MSEIRDAIRQAQVSAGERVVIEHLRRQGLLQGTVELEREVLDAAIAWRGAEVEEYETDSCDEREKRHQVTCGAESFLRGKVIRLIEALERTEQHSS